MKTTFLIDQKVFFWGFSIWKNQTKYNTTKYLVENFVLEKIRENIYYI